jgi:peptide deformylase
MTILKIVTAPDPILKMTSAPISEVTDGTRKFMNDMLETMYEDRGVGLAAVQVGILKQIIVIDLQEDEHNDREEKKPEDFYPLFMINPQIVSSSEEYVVAIEGCLSVPEMRIEVPRPESINVRFLDYFGKQTELNVSGWLARVIQHEMDHLTGKLIIDYLSNLKKELALSKLKKLKKSIL